MMRSPEGGTAAAAAAHRNTRETDCHNLPQGDHRARDCAVGTFAQPAAWHVMQSHMERIMACHKRLGPTREAQVLGRRLAHLQGGQGAGRAASCLAALHLHTSGRDKQDRALLPTWCAPTHTLSRAQQCQLPGSSFCPPRLQLSSTEDFATAGAAQSRAILRILPPRLLVSSSWRGLAPVPHRFPLPHLHDCRCDRLLCGGLIQHCGNVPVKQPVTRPLELTAGLLLRLVLPAACCTCCVCVCCWAVVGVYVPERLGHV